MDAIRQRIDDTVDDPATAEALKPWYGVSCKRPCYHDDYLPAFNRDNVTLVDTDGLGVTAVTEKRDSSSATPSTRSTASSTPPASTRRAPSTRTDSASTRSARDGISMSDAWAKGAWTLHGIWAHDFPNLAMNSHIQGGQHINIAYAATKNGEHTAYTIRRALDAGAVVEPDLDAEEEWFQICAGTAGAYAQYFAACTPGYLSNEFQMPEERDSRLGLLHEQRRRAARHLQGVA